MYLGFIILYLFVYISVLLIYILVLFSILDYIYFVP